MYRPKGWVTPKVERADIDKNPKKTWDIAHSYGWRDGYEAGADAMLEGLKGEALYSNDSEKMVCAQYISGKDILNATNYQKGWLVFIPQGE